MKRVWTVALLLICASAEIGAVRKRKRNEFQQQLVARAPVAASSTSPYDGPPHNAQRCCSSACYDCIHSTRSYLLQRGEWLAGSVSSLFCGAAFAACGEGCEQPVLQNCGNAFFWCGAIVGIAGSTFLLCTGSFERKERLNNVREANE